MEYAPVIVFAYDRPVHLDKTLSALAKNNLAKQTILYVYCDGPASSADEATKDRILRSRKVAMSQTGFKEVHVVEHFENKGLAANIIDGVTEIVNQYGRVIVFEDDIVSTKGALTYLNDALECYKDEEKVMHVSAYMFPHTPKLPETFFYDVPYPAGGWATWVRAWKHFDADTVAHINYWKGRWSEFDVVGEDFLSRQLWMNLDGRLKTWFIKWYSSMHKVGGLCLYPGISLSNNIGWDSTGVTSCTTDAYTNHELAQHVSVDRQHIERNRTAYRIIRVWYSGHWYSMRNIKWKLKTIKRSASKIIKGL